MNLETLFLFFLEEICWMLIGICSKAESIWIFVLLKTWLVEKGYTYIYGIDYQYPSLLRQDDIGAVRLVIVWS